MSQKPKALLSWSTGKDCAFALHEARAQGEVDVVGILTTVTREYGRVSMHGVREELLDAQAKSLGLPCHKVFIPASCPNSVYEEAMGKAMAAARASGVTHVVFGDLFLSDIRRYREEKLASVGMKGVFPLWMRPTKELAARMLAEGFSARVVCVDTRKLAARFAGRTFDAQLLSELPAEVDACGENGEFHTFVGAGPIFHRPLALRSGEVVEREGFAFADVLLS
jgi:uncharacterized protein (TIGR00290 family)